METKKNGSWNNDTELFDMMKEQLYAAVISDALDAAGYREQALRHTIRPLHPDNSCGGSCDAGAVCRGLRDSR